MREGIKGEKERGRRDWAGGKRLGFHNPLRTCPQ
jgi:hypothetical protein